MSAWEFWLGLIVGYVAGQLIALVVVAFFVGAAGSEDS